MTTLDLRGRDLVIVPEKHTWEIATLDLLSQLFGQYLPPIVKASIGRDKRQHFLRTKPMYFSQVKQALRRQGTSFTYTDKHLCQFLYLVLHILIIHEWKS